MACALPGFALAQVTMVPDSTCNQSVLDAMNERAWLEGKREMEVAQRIILKPDSVLQYSCFSKRVAEGGGDGYVSTMANKYLSDNFNNAFAGGQYPHPGDPCAYMNIPWDQVKCEDSGLCETWKYSRCKNIDISFFNPLVDFATGDPRTLPSACNEPNRTANWQNALDAATPESSDLMTLVSNYLPPALDVLDPTDCSAHTPIDTGLIVFDEVQIEVQDPNFGPQVSFQLTERPDRFCAAPGCYYQYDPVDLNGPGECMDKPQ